MKYACYSCAKYVDEKHVVRIVAYPNNVHPCLVGLCLECAEAAKKSGNSDVEENVEDKVEEEN